MNTLKNWLALIPLALSLMFTVSFVAAECPCDDKKPYENSGITCDGNTCSIFATDGTCCAYVCSDFDKKLACGFHYNNPDCDQDVQFEFSEDDFDFDYKDDNIECEVTNSDMSCKIKFDDGGALQASLQNGGQWQIQGWYNQGNLSCSITGGCDGDGNLFGDFDTNFTNPSGRWCKFRGSQKPDGTWEFGIQAGGGF